ncbi:hypothetical protein OBP_085 [Pseudomonas phage OBP]|uniref:hypothetical protein n=1 Tax=Pseudomonas phage OBP TaxID=1124849 RepID=UPI000240D433|nr:hypothetical protein OBP_085 [Pseudomonas phage OBP]AEV89522.1 hypothetical protein OBP_085 [Pseudomonas phage OBP]
MNVLNLVSFNVRAPEIAQLDTLQVVAAGLNILLDGHKALGLDMEDFSLMENANLTMGDHASELCNGSDEDFDRIYKNAKNVLNTVLATQGEELVGFAANLLSIDDMMTFEYPGLIRLCVKEGSRNGNAGSSLLYLTKSAYCSGYSY